MEVPSPRTPNTEKRGDSPTAAFAAAGRNAAAPAAIFPRASRRASALREVLTRELLAWVDSGSK